MEDNEPFNDNPQGLDDREPYEEIDWDTVIMLVRAFAFGSLCSIGLGKYIVCHQRYSWILCHIGGFVIGLAVAAIFKAVYEWMRTDFDAEEQEKW